MDKILVYLLEHPKDFVSVVSMLAVVYLLKAIRDDQIERLKKFEAALLDTTREVREIKALLLSVQYETKNVVELERKLTKIDKRVHELEVINGF